MNHANFDAVRAMDARFDRAVLHGASCVAANFAFTSFRHADLDGSNVTGATFFTADLRNARFENTVRTHADFEDADTTCVSRTAPFGVARRFYLGVNERMLRAVEAAIECSDDAQADLQRLLRSAEFGWRDRVVASTGVMLAGANATTVEALWNALEESSWASPQLMVAAAKHDPALVERAVRFLQKSHLRQKTREACAAALLTWFRDSISLELADSLKSFEGSEGFRVATRWAARFDELTQ